MRAQGMSLETARALGLYRLYGSEMSMFTAKVRPVFRRKGLRYVEQLATQARWQESEDLTGNRMIPIVFTPEGACVQDSSLIIDLLEARHPEIPVESPDPVLKLLGRIFERYHDEFMPLLAIYYRWIKAEAIEEGKSRAHHAVHALHGAARAGRARHARRGRARDRRSPPRRHRMGRGDRGARAGARGARAPSARAVRLTHGRSALVIRALVPGSPRGLFCRS
jgi:glutathione S-transferase